jgi:hypothetical protein
MRALDLVNFVGHSLITEVTLIDSGDRLAVEPTQPLFGFNMATRLGIRIFFFHLSVESASLSILPHGSIRRGVPV